jgi:hypothetical protein
MGAKPQRQTGAAHVERVPSAKWRRASTKICRFYFTEETLVRGAMNSPRSAWSFIEQVLELIVDETIRVPPFTDVHAMAAMGIEERATSFLNEHDCWSMIPRLALPINNRHSLSYLMNKDYERSEKALDGYIFSVRDQQRWRN